MAPAWTARPTPTSRLTQGRPPCPACGPGLDQRGGVMGAGRKIAWIVGPVAIAMAVPALGPIGYLSIATLPVGVIGVVLIPVLLVLALVDRLRGPR